MAEIPLTQGRVAIIDDEDAGRVLQHSWYSVQRGENEYAVCHAGRNRTIYMHRLILNASRGETIDHRNGNGLDNRKENLRLATHAQNIRNSRRPCHNTSGYKGVMRKRRKWQARIVFNGKTIFLGVFDAKQDAARAYDLAALLLHGEFARINFPAESELLRRVLARVQDARQAEDGSGYCPHKA